MKYPKFVLATDGDRTAAILNGVFIGKGLERLDFCGESLHSKIRLMELDINAVELETEEEAENHFTEFLEELAKETAPAANKGENKKGGEKVKISATDFVRQAIRKNLLTALEKASMSGDVKGAIRLARFLLKLYGRRNEEMIDFSEGKGGEERWTQKSPR